MNPEAETREAPRTRTDQKTLTIQHLHLLQNGRVGQAINAKIREAISDIAVRPNETKARKVQITLAFDPIMDKTHGDIQNIDIDVQVDAKIPSMRSISQLMPTRDPGVAVFMSQSPEDARQEPLRPTEG